MKTPFLGRRELVLRPAVEGYTAWKVSFQFHAMAVPYEKNV